MPSEAPLHQLLGRLRPDDAVAEHALVLQAGLRERGVESELFAEEVDPRLASRVRPLAECGRGADPETRYLLHYAGGGVARLASVAAGRLAVAVYDLTGPEAFVGFDAGEAQRRDAGPRELAAVASRAELGLGASEPLRRRLSELGFRRTGLLPARPDLPAAREPHAVVVERMLADGRTNVLFCGRLAPDEALEDVLRCFALYQRFVEPASRLVLAGDTGSHPRYYGALTRMADELRLDEVVFLHAPGAADRGACYAAADVFLSLAPAPGDAPRLIEAMAHGVPVIALEGGAVRERLAGGGVLLTRLHHAELAELIDRVVRDARLRQAVLETQRRAARRLAGEEPAARLLEALGGGAAPPGASA